MILMENIDYASFIVEQVVEAGYQIDPDGLTLLIEQNTSPSLISQIIQVDICRSISMHSQ